MERPFVGVHGKGQANEKASRGLRVHVRMQWRLERRRVICSGVEAAWVGALTRCV